jgi:hypothetical protein
VVGEPVSGKAVRNDKGRRLLHQTRSTDGTVPKVSGLSGTSLCLKFRACTEKVVKKSHWKTLVVVFAAATLSSCARSAEPLTAEDIVARCAEAMGGEGGIQTLRTLSFRLSSPNRPQQLLWEIARPNFVRKERAGDLILVFDGNRAAFLQAPPNEDGTPGEPHVVDQADWHHFEMDIALYVPAFFDYPAAYVDTTSVNGSSAYLLQVDLPMGGVAAYAVDAESFLPTKVALPDWDYEIFPGDYREVGGFLYFHEYRTGADPENVTVLEDLEVNVELPADRFAIPSSLK